MVAGQKENARVFPKERNKKEKLSRFGTKRRFPVTYCSDHWNQTVPPFTCNTHGQGPHIWDSRIPEQRIAAPLVHTWGLGRPWGCSSPSRGHRSTAHIQSWPTACHAAVHDTTKGTENTSMNPAAKETSKYIFSLLSPPPLVLTLLFCRPRQSLPTIALTPGCIVGAKSNLILLK